MAQDDYAILVAIRFYPGLGSLRGPENDAEDFFTWLRDPSGGDVPEPNIERIYSSQFEETSDPYAANPTESTFKRALERILKSGPLEWKDRAGRRLYLYFAGHGFTAGALTNPALYTAQAQINDPVHIAALDYASRVRNGAFFDEIVLVMDCCQDVLKATLPPTTLWTAPERPGRAAKVKLMFAFGAQRGLKSFEEGEFPDPTRGLFSSAFMEALRTAPSDAEGFVSASDVEGRLLQIWKDRYVERFAYEPPTHAPRNMQLYRREMPSSSPDGALPAELLHRSSSGRRTTVHLVAEDAGAQIRLLDAQGSLLQEGVGDLRRALEPGGYMARFRIGSAVKDRKFNVDPKGTVCWDYPKSTPVNGGRIDQPPLQFSSPVPMLQDASTAPQAFNTVSKFIQIAATQISFEESASILVVASHFPRDADQEPELLRITRSPLRLLRIDGVSKLHATEMYITKRPEMTIAIATDLEPGSYLLGVPRRQQNEWYWEEVILILAPGRRTEVYINAVADVYSELRFDLEFASVLSVPSRQTGTLKSPETRLTEVARLALIEGRRGVGESTIQALLERRIVAPMLALYAAYSLAREKKVDTYRIGLMCECIDEQLMLRTADTKLLRAFCRVSRQEGSEVSLGADGVPCMTAGWNFISTLVRSPEIPRVSQAVQQQVGIWRTPSSLWTQTHVPFLFDAYRMQRAPTKPDEIAWPDQSTHLSSVARMIERPQGPLAPIQQALRRAILAAAQLDSPPTLQVVIDQVAHYWSVDPSLAKDALSALGSPSQMNAPQKKG